MRIIPKRSKMKSTIFKSWGLKDIIIMFIILVAVVLICMSNLPGRFIVAITIAVISIALFMPTGSNTLFYTEALQFIKFAAGKKKFTKEKDIDSLMPFKDINEQGVIIYDNYYAVVLEVGQKEFGIEDDYQQDIDIDTLAQALKYIEDGQAIDLIKIDRPVKFDGQVQNVWDKLTAVEDDDEERKAVKQLVYYSRLQQLDDINNVQKIYCPFYYIVIYDSDERSLDQSANSIAETIGQINLDTKRLNATETAVFLKYSFTCNFDEREADSLKREELMGWIKPKKITFGTTKYKIDDVTAFSYCIADYPNAVGNAWGAKLFDIDNTKVVMQIRPVDQFKAIKRIDGAVNELASKQERKASEMIEKDAHIASMGALLENLQNENEFLYDVTTTITRFCYDEGDNIQTARRKLRQDLSAQGFVASNLFARQIDGFIAANVSRRIKLKNHERGINSSSLAAVFPFVHTNIMEPGGKLYGVYNNYPLILDMWKRSADYTNSNGMIIGKPGGGKSFFSKLMLTHEWTEGTMCFILDPEAEYLQLARNLKGTIIDVGNAVEGRINPFHIYDVLTDDGSKAEPTTIFAAHLKFLESFFRTIMPDCDADVLELINNIVVEVYAGRGITEYTDCSEFDADKFPLFDDVYGAISARIEKEENLLFKNNLLRAQMYLKKFARGGRYADLWNAPSTLLTTSDFVVFNFQSLFANKNQTVANAQMLLVFRYMEQQIINIREANNAAGKMRHIIVFADEAHLFIDKNCPIAVDFFYQMNKRIRKYFGSFIPATQNISDWNSTEELRNKTSVIIKNSQYNFVFGLSKMDMQDLTAVFGGAGAFNDEEIYLITTAGRGETFFIGSSRQRAMVQIIAHQFVQALFEKPLKNVLELPDYQAIRELSARDNQS